MVMGIYAAKLEIVNRRLA